MTLTPQQIAAFDQVSGLKTTPGATPPDLASISRADQIRALGKSTPVTSVNPEIVQPHVQNFVDKSASDIKANVQGGVAQAQGDLNQGMTPNPNQNTAGNVSAGMKGGVKAVTDVAGGIGNAAHAVFNDFGHALVGGAKALGVNTDKVGSDISNAFGQVKNAVGSVAGAAENNPNTAVQIALANHPVAQAVIGAISKFGEQALKTPQAQEAIHSNVDTFHQAMKALGDFNQQHPGYKQVAGNIANLGQGAIDVGTAAELGGNAIDLGSKVANGVYDTVGNAVSGASEAAGNAVDAVKNAPNALIDTIAGPEAAGRRLTNVAAADAEQAALKALPEEGQNAVANGLARQDVQTIVNANPEEQAAMQKMTEAAKNFEVNPSAPHPSEVVGNEITSRIDNLNAIKKQVGKQLGDYAANIPSEDLGDVQGAVLKRLQSTPGLEGVTIEEIKGQPTLNFSNTVMSGNKAAKADVQRIFSDVIDRADNAQQLHMYRQGLFEDLGGAKAAQTPITATQDKAYEATRQGIADVLDEASPQYKALNSQYRDIVQPLQNMQKYFKALPGADADILSQRGAALARQLTSNAPSGTVIRQTIRDMEEQLAKYGQEPGTDVGKLQDYLNSLSHYFDTTKGTSLAGQIKAGTNGVSEAVDTLSKGKSGIVSKVLDKTIGKITEPYAVTKATQQKALTDLLESLSSPVPKADALLGGLSQAKITGLTQFERAKNLTPEYRAIETEGLQHVLANEDSILSHYKEDPSTQGGKIVNTDSFRKYIPGYNGTNSAAVQEPASYLAKRARAEALKGPGDFSTIFIGGSGTGKTSAVSSLEKMKPILDNSALVLDGNLSSMSSANKIIAESKATGKIPRFLYTYREPVDSLEKGVVKRMLENPAEQGRIVPTKVVAENHIGSWKVAQELHNQGYDVNFMDNSLGAKKTKVIPFTEMEQKVQYPSEEKLTQIFNDKIKELHNAGKITEKQYKGYTS